MEKKQKEILLEKKPKCELPPLLGNPKNYQTLISNKHISFRKELCEEMAAIAFPTHQHDVWKYRFLHPEKNIPEKDLERIAPIMEEALSRKLRQQELYLKKRINELANNYRQELEKFSQILEQTTKVINYHERV